jgi:hypothetical protein
MNPERTLDVETKLRLLISLVNDEGKDKLNANIEKLIVRLGEYAESHKTIVSEYFIKAYFHI